MARGMHKPKKLEARRKVYDGHGKNPAQNPSNANGMGNDMHRPGSLK